MHTYLMLVRTFFFLQKLALFDFLSSAHRRAGCFPGAWSSWHLQIACLQLTFWAICVIHRHYVVSLVSERSGRNRLLREAPSRSALYMYINILENEKNDSCEMEDFVETPIYRLRGILRSRVLLIRVLRGTINIY